MAKLVKYHFLPDIITYIPDENSGIVLYDPSSNNTEVLNLDCEFVLNSFRKREFEYEELCLTTTLELHQLNKVIKHLVDNNYVTKHMV